MSSARDDQIRAASADFFRIAAIPGSVITWSEHDETPDGPMITTRYRVAGNGAASFDPNDLTQAEIIVEDERDPS